MKQYQDTLDILLNGRDGYRVVFRGDRTGTGTYGFFGHQMRFDLSEGFPLLTTKQVNFKAIVAELIWFLRGSTNAKELNELGAKIWDEWAVRYETIVREKVLPLLHSLDDEASNQLHTVLTSPPLHCVWVGENGDVPEGWVRCSDLDGNETVEELYIDPKAYWASAFVESVARGYLSEKDIEQLGELGPVYGAMWRNWSAPEIYLTNDEETKARFMESGLPYAEWLKSEPEVGALVKLKNIDQIAELIENLKTKPYSRRHVISGWNPAVLPDERVKPDVNALRGKQALPPCHTLFQFYVEPMDVHDRMNLLDSSDEAWDSYEKACQENNQEIFEELTRYLDAWEVPDKRLSCQLYQRSADYILGVPFNIASYALLTHVLAHLCDYAVGDFVHTFGDIHLYSNHLEQAKEQLSRDPRPLPTLKISKDLKSIDDLKPEHIQLEGYDPHPPIKAPISV